MSSHLKLPSSSREDTTRYVSTGQKSIGDMYSRISPGSGRLLTMRSGRRRYAAYVGIPLYIGIFLIICMNIGAIASASLKNAVFKINHTLAGGKMRASVFVDRSPFPSPPAGIIFMLCIYIFLLLCPTIPIPQLLYIVMPSRVIFSAL